MSFPLYDNLSINIPEIDITNKEKEMIVKSIKKFDTSIHERIYALIRCHQLQNSKDISLLPYDGKAAKSTGNTTTNITFDLEKFPKDLKHIIHRFCVIENKNVK